MRIIGAAHKQRACCNLSTEAHSSSDTKCTAGGGGEWRRGGRLEGSKQWRQALVGQSRALLIVSVLIESHNETSGAGIAARHPAATGSPYMEMRLILDLLLNAAGIFAARQKASSREE